MYQETILDLSSACLNTSHKIRNHRWKKINFFENFWVFRFLFHDGCISSLRIIFYIPFCRELNGESSARNSLILEREDRDQTSKY